MKRLAPFILGILFTLLCLVGGGYVFITHGGVSMDTSAAPLPLEKQVAKLALSASIGSAGDQKDPLPVDETNLVSGARLYKVQCAMCHSIPGTPRTPVSQGMFPKPPQLLEKDDMVVDDPEGITFWKVTHGIRLSGMPAFGPTLSENERWQLTMLVAHADKLPPAAVAALR